MSVQHRRHALVAATIVPLVLLAAVACAPARSATPTPEKVAGLVGGLPSTAASELATTPAPSTAGDLTAESLPSTFLGFTAQERPPAENEYVPNGTWVHGLDAKQAATEALPQCAANTGTVRTVPDAALMGSYLDAQKRPGNGLALSFSSREEANAYADEYRQVLASCTDGSITTQVIGSEEGWYAGRRTVQGTPWTETISVAGKHVILMIVSDAATSTPAEVKAAAQDLTR